MIDDSTVAPCVLRKFSIESGSDKVESMAAFGEITTQKLLNNCDSDIVTLHDFEEEENAERKKILRTTAQKLSAHRKRLKNIS